MFRIFSRKPPEKRKTQPPPQPTSGTLLNLGCGFDHRKGWLNIDFQDFHKPDLVSDVTWLKEVPDLHADYALAQDILEHIHRAKCVSTLREWNRVLKIGGKVEIRTTDVLGVAELLRRPDFADPSKQRDLLQCLFGTQNYEGDFHLNGFTETSLTADLMDSGFAVEYVDKKDVWLLHVVATKISHCPPDPILRLASEEAFIEAAVEKIKSRPATEVEKSEYSYLLRMGAPRETIIEAITSAR